MDLTFSDKETAFRDELRAWLADNQPGEKPQADAGDDAQFAYRRDWQRHLYDAGWAAPAWPTEDGGGHGPPSTAGAAPRRASRRFTSKSSVVHGCRSQQIRSACCWAARH